MADGQVIFEIKGDNKPIKDSLNDTTNAIKNASKDWDRAADDSGSNISSALTNAFSTVVKSAAFYKIGKMLVDLGVESINLASNLEEVQNKVDVTFGAEGSKKIEQWATAAAKNYGITELQAKEYTSTLGAMMKSSGLAGEEIVDMSTAMAGLAADMASFYNLPFEEAFQKISSGLAGETEPLRRLGINMSVANLEAYALAQGIETAWDEMSAGEQFILRQKYLFQATADAQGDFLRTNDSYANTIKRIETSIATLKTDLGETLLSLINPLSSAVADFLEVLTLPPEKNAFDKASESIAEAQSNATQATSILDYLDKLYQKYGEAATQTGEWASAMERLKQVFPEINGYIDEQTGKLTASNNELKEYVENSRLASIEESKKAAIQELQNQYYEASVKYGAAAGERDFAESQMQSITDSLINYIVENYKASADAKQMPEDVRKQFLDAGYWRNMLTSGQFDMRDIFMSARNAAKFNDQNTDVVDQFQSDYEMYAESLSSASAEVENLKGEMESLQGQLATAESVLASLSSSASAAAANLDAVASSGGGGGGGGGFNISLGGKGNPSVMMTSFATGLDSVPFDGFLASLHEGESILTAEEARVWRNMKYGQSLAGNQFDYGAMGSAIGANMPNFNGMEVRWNGQVLGRVIAAQQADSLRTMERSGWRG
jgi:hypothetical protein